MSTMKSITTSAPILCRAEVSSTGNRRWARTASRRPFFRSATGKRALVEKLLHQRVVAFGDHFHQGFVRFLGVLDEGCGNFFDFRLAVAIRRVGQRLHGDQVHHPAKAFLRTDRQMQGNHAAAEDALHRFEGAVETGQFAVHPVEDERARQIVLGGVVPHFLGDHLHARGGVNQD
jgi:hypothetical protein